MKASAHRAWNVRRAIVLTILVSCPISCVSHTLTDLATGQILESPHVAERTKALRFHVSHWVTRYKDREPDLLVYGEIENVLEHRFTSRGEARSEENLDDQLRFALREKGVKVVSSSFNRRRPVDRADIYIVGWFDQIRSTPSWWWAYNCFSCTVGFVVPAPIFLDGDYQFAVSVFGSDGKLLNTRRIRCRQEFVSYGVYGVWPASIPRYIRNQLWSAAAADLVIDMVQEHESAKGC